MLLVELEECLTLMNVKKKFINRNKHQKDKKSYFRKEVIFMYTATVILPKDMKALQDKFSILMGKITAEMMNEANLTPEEREEFIKRLEAKLEEE